MISLNISDLVLPPNFVLGCDPPPLSICIMKRGGGEGSHTLFWNHSERWTTSFESPLGDHTRSLILREIKVKFYSSFLKRAKKSWKSTGSFDLFANFRRRSLNKVGSCFPRLTIASGGWDASFGSPPSPRPSSVAACSTSGPSWTPTRTPSLSP